MIHVLLHCIAPRTISQFSSESSSQQFKWLVQTMTSICTRDVSRLFGCLVQSRGIDIFNRPLVFHVQRLGLCHKTESLSLRTGGPNLSCTNQSTIATYESAADV